MAEKSDVLWVTAQFALFAVIGVLAVSTGGDPPVIAVGAGAVVVIAGLVLAMDAVRRMGSSVSPFPTPSRDATLVTSGSFRLVRHPIYGGVILMALGVGVAAWSPATVVASLVLVPFFLAKSSHEERLLNARFDEYDGYVAATPRRLLPWVI